MLLESRYAVCKLPPDAALPSWARGAFVSLTRTPEELSVVCLENAVSKEVQREEGWRLLKVAGPLLFSQIGILAALTAPLAEAGVSIFVISTFNTDYLLVKDARLTEAISALEAAGHSLEGA